MTVAVRPGGLSLAVRRFRRPELTCSPLDSGAPPCDARLPPCSCCWHLLLRPKERVAWQIGTPDHSYAEFAFAGDYQAYAKAFGAAGSCSCVGRSDAARDWPFIQPGPSDHWSPAGGRPWTIRFNLADEPRGVFTLRIELADVQKQFPPLYMVSINGSSGTFQLAPGGGDASLAQPCARESRRSWRSPCRPRCSRRGRTRFAWPAPRAPGSQYDAITLLADPQGAMRPAEIQSVTARPTPFFLRRNGGLRRAVDVPWWP